MPPDPTNMEDMVHVALFSGNPADAVAHAADMDVWLAAHLADVMEAVGLFKHNPEKWVCSGCPEYSLTNSALTALVKITS
jgi:hypothetical protein